MVHKDDNPWTFKFPSLHVRTRRAWVSKRVHAGQRYCQKRDVAEARGRTTDGRFPSACLLTYSQIMIPPKDHPPREDEPSAVPKRTTISFGLTGAAAKRPGLAKASGTPKGVILQETTPTSTTTDSDKVSATTGEPAPLIIPLPKDASIREISREEINMPRAWEAYNPHKIGLQVRKPLGGEAGRDEKEAATSPRDVSSLAPFLKRIRSSNLEEGGEDSTLTQIEPQAYAKTPVDQFGAALLRGMGWREGEGVGRRRRQRRGQTEGETSTQAQDVRIIEPRVRPRGLGLGATVGGSAKDKEQAREEVTDDGLRLRATLTGPSRSPNVSFAKAQSMMGVGSPVLIRGGVHAGEQGIVTRIVAEEAQVRLGSSGTVLLVDLEHLQLVPREEDTDGGAGAGTRAEASDAGGGQKGKDCATWLHPHIRVRFMSQGSSRLAMYHGREGDVLDVHQGLAIIRMLNGALITDVSASDLQPSRPVMGETVLVLTRGRHQGLRGVLLAVDGPTAHVQMLDAEEGGEDDPGLATGPNVATMSSTDSGTIVGVPLDSIAPYCI